MKILVSGGGGFIGSNFIRYVLSLGKGYDVVNVDALTYAGNLANLAVVASNPLYTFVKADICDAVAMGEAMRGCDAVVHFAAESHVDRSIYEPMPVIETNVTGTFILLQVARKLNIPRFVHISTDEVYGDLAAGTASDENALLQPNSPYSASKASADLLVRSCSGSQIAVHFVGGNMNEPRNVQFTSNLQEYEGTGYVGFNNRHGFVNAAVHMRFGSELHHGVTPAHRFAHVYCTANTGFHT